MAGPQTSCEQQHPGRAVEKYRGQDRTQEDSSKGDAGDSRVTAVTAGHRLECHLEA